MANAPAETPPKKNSSALIIRIVLFSVLGLLVCALTYDRLVALPARNAGYDTVLAMLDKAVVAEDVKEALGQKPSSTYEGEDYFVEVYSWRAGYLVNSHSIWVIYSPKNTGLLYGVTEKKPTAENLPISAGTPQTPPTNEPAPVVEGDAAH